MKQITCENYLKLIFNLQRESGEDVKPQSISKNLSVSAPAVSEMLKKLAAEKYIEYAPYQGIRLTKKGLSQGQNMVRRHRIWEMYLHQILGYSWDRVHEEAEQLEHASSDELIDRLEKALGFPKYDPHGDPIPSKNGVFPKEIKCIPLSHCKAGDEVTVVRVSDFDTEFLHYIKSIGIQLQLDLSITEIRSFDRSFGVQFLGKKESLSELATHHIFVVLKRRKS